MAVKLTGQIPGGNPRDAGAISQRDGVFHIAPFSEDGDANYKFHLLVQAANPSSRAEEIAVEIDWADSRFSMLRNHVFVGHGGLWETVRGEIRGSIIAAKLTIEPGESLIALHPAYGLADHERLVNWAVLEGARKEKFGRTAAGHELDLLWFGEAGATKPALLVLGRGHPYETSGSYACAEIVRFLSVGSPRSRRVLERFQVGVIAMANPDGVEAGYCKAAALNGLNPLEDAVGKGDKTCDSLQALFDRVKPAGLLDVHAWMHREDAVFIYDRGEGDRFLKAFDRKAAGVPEDWEWQVMDRTLGPHNSSIDLRHYALEELGASLVVLAIQWFGKKTPIATVRSIGAESLAAFAEAIA